MAVTGNASDAELAVIKALQESDYADLIPIEFALDVARIAVTAARPVVTAEFSDRVVEALRGAEAKAEAYHYKAALDRAVTIVRGLT